MKQTKTGQGETEEGQNNTIQDNNEKTEPKIGFKIDKSSSSNKVSKKLFKITLPIEMLTYSEAGYSTCPVAFCRKKIPKNLSIEDHMRQHLDLIFQEVKTHVESVPTTKEKEGENKDKKEKKQFDVQYHCPNKECKYSDVKDVGHFLKVKYLKQHYVKVHAEKNLKCTKCQKSFSFSTYLDIHQAMCGMKFSCSCKKLYNSLEALQTHSRRKNHTFDYTKYKELLNVEKNRIQETKASQLAQLNNNNNDNNSNSPSSNTTSSSSKLSNKSQNSIDKSSSSSSSDLPTVIDFTNHPEIQFGMIIGELPVQCRTKIDFGTQTVIQQLQALQQQQQQLCTGWTPITTTTSTASTQVEESINTLNNNNNNNSSNHIGSKRSSSSSSTTTTTTSSEGLEFTGPRPPKRKKSAQTQTARVRVRVSTETQTINVVKRRRSTRYKQSAEAETQCHNHEVGHNSQTNLIKTILLNDISNNNNTDHNNSHNNTSSSSSSTTCSTSTITNNNSNSNNNMVTTPSRIADKKVDVPLKFLETDSSPCPTKEYSSIANPISEFDSDSFFKEMEEVHIQTQTEPDLLYFGGGGNGVGTILNGGENIFSGYDDVNITLNDADITNFQFNFVTTETQTANPIQSTCCQNNSHHHDNGSSSNSWSTCNFMESTTTSTSTNTGGEGHSIDCEIQTGLISQDEHCNNSGNSINSNNNCSINDNLKSVNTNYLETMDNETQTMDVEKELRCVIF